MVSKNKNGSSTEQIRQLFLFGLNFGTQYDYQTEYYSSGFLGKILMSLR